MNEQGKTGKALQGLIVAGMGGGSGKSVVAVGLAAAFTRQGRLVVPFKKGPDYIDSGWLSLAAGRPCYNLDPYLMSPAALEDSFFSYSHGAEMAIIEGNRGLYDGVDVEGSFSTAELAVNLGLPVLLVVDCTKTTRTVAAMVLGCKMLDPRVDIRGVVLNRIGTARHAKIVTGAIEKYVGIPVVGAIRRSSDDVFPQRHLGVTPGPEHQDAGQAISLLAERVEKSLDLAMISSLMNEVPVRSNREASVSLMPAENLIPPVRIGVIRDAAFQFYYQENLDGLENLGAEIVEINALTEDRLPEIDGLYIGGGFPETNVRDLSANVSFMNSLKERALDGLPVYAECGGLIYLGRSLHYEGSDYPLVGVFPVDFTLEKRPQAHGYTVLSANPNNPFYPVSTEIKGHEFRYSKVVNWQGDPGSLAFNVLRGVGFSDGRDGLVYRNVLALYTHVHAVGTPHWAPGIVAKARDYQQAEGEKSNG